MMDPKEELKNAIYKECVTTENSRKKAYLQHVPYWHYTQEEKMNLTLKRMQRHQDEQPTMITPTMIQHALDMAKHQQASPASLKQLEAEYE